MGEEMNSPQQSEDDDDLSYLFSLDKNPSHIADDLDIPKYSSKFKVLDNKEKKEEPERKPQRPVGVTCWNCGGSHNLRDCTEPRNHAVIAQKRAESQTKFTRAVRYHVDEEQKYSHLCPGKISDRLREAMGLKSNQAPPFVYKMRELGYPPGWVEEAKVTHSGLSMFDSSGQEVKDPELEDGEIMSHVDRDKYDFKKLIEYPGFNVPFEPDTVDETEQLRAHPIKESQSIQHMLQLWSGKKTGAYRRKRMKLEPSVESPSVSNRSIPLKEEDMEVDAEREEVIFLPPTDKCGFVPPLPVNSPSKPPPPSTPPSASGSAKRKLSTTDDDISPPGVDEERSESEDEKKTEKSEEKDSSKNIQNPSPVGSYNGRVKSVSSGTPVITRSEFKYLPSPDNFSKNICDVINFENLPDATGKYDQMHGLIKKVRTYVTQALLKDDDDDDEA